MKSNREMNRMEFDFSYAIKRAINQLNYVQMEIESAKNVGMQGLSKGALALAENSANMLKDDLYKALKSL